MDLLGQLAMMKVFASANLTLILTNATSVENIFTTILHVKSVIVTQQVSLIHLLAAALYQKESFALVKKGLKGEYVTNVDPYFGTFKNIILLDVKTVIAMLLVPLEAFEYVTQKREIVLARKMFILANVIFAKMEPLIFKKIMSLDAPIVPAILVVQF